ncbi:hypothetical protein GF312_19935 [Candidatus Poribacteria bacterium]|nr:hypothetical protein [Candidatus Poribacteria bacterium]
MKDFETELYIGNPAEIPFKSEYKQAELLELQKNVEKRLEYGIASASGIRQIFDNTYGDEKTDFVDGDGSVITDAAKIHVATITDSFVKLLKKLKDKNNLTLVLAIDSRPTGPTIADIVARVLAYHGLNIKYTFITPVTEVAVYSKEYADGFIYISSSHNPMGYNGIKLGIDGRILPGDLALPFIKEYQAKLKCIDNAKSMIEAVNKADISKIKEVFEGIKKFRDESRQVYSKLLDSIITGIENQDKTSEIKEKLKSRIQDMNLWIGIDPNGGARKDKEYLESWGFNVLEINSCPRLDMVHELAPIPEACQQARDDLIKAQKEGKNVIAFFVYDTDGDRKNIVLSDGKGGAIIPGVQMIFALDILSSILNSLDNEKDIAIAINGPTTSLMDQFARYLGFRIRRVEVGEANVATAGKELHEQGYYMPLMGEGSNGSVLSLDLLVREPIHSVRTLIDFITKPDLTKKLLKHLGNEDNYDNWHSPEKIGKLFVNIINSIPPSRTTDFFTDEGIRKGKVSIPPDKFKSAFDSFFDSKIWPRVSQKLSKEYGGESEAEYVYYEGINELRGKGNRITNSGGYKIEFYVKTKNNRREHIGWLWFRPSGTEVGVMRRGVSVSHWDVKNPEAREIVDRVYKYLDNILTDTLNTVETSILNSKKALTK